MNSARNQRFESSNKLAWLNMVVGGTLTSDTKTMGPREGEGRANDRPGRAEGG